MRFLFVISLACITACTTPTSPQPVTSSKAVVEALPTAPPMIVPVRPSSPPQHVSDCMPPDKLSDFLTQVVADATKMTADTYGLVVYFEIDTTGTQTHIFGELRRSHPRLHSVVMNYFVVPSLLDYPSSNALLSAMRSGLPENVEVRIVNQPEPVVMGCRPAAPVKGRVEGSY